MNETRLNRLHKVLISPLVSEKTTRSGEAENSVTFWVIPDATKAEVAQAVKHFFNGVEVQSVRTSVKHRPFKSVGQRTGRGVKKKKAYVKLAPGHEIQLTEFE